MLSVINKVFKLVINYWYPTPKRKNIPKKTRMLVWQKVNGNKDTGVCYCCNEKLSIRNFHCSHRIAHANGGKIELSNLFPTCMHCNLSMGKTELYTYIKKKHLTGPGSKLIK